MNKVAQFYRELVATLTERLRNGERDIDALVEQARARVTQASSHPLRHSRHLKERS